MQLFSERKSGTKKKGDFEILKKLCEKHFRDYLFQEVRTSTGPRLAPSYRTQTKFDYKVMEHYFLKQTKESNMSPQNYASCVTDLETLFDMLETAYSFQQEYLEATEKDKRLFYFEHQLNDSLKDWGYEMKQGVVMKLPEDGMKELVEEAIPSGVIQDDESKLQHAIAQFFKRNASDGDKRNAIRSLGDLLESVRGELQSEPQLGADENAIFNILNTYGIRHHNDVQKHLEEPYLTWTFYLLLNTVKTFIKIKKQ